MLFNKPVITPQGNLCSPCSISTLVFSNLIIQSLVHVDSGVDILFVTSTRPILWTEPRSIFIHSGGWRLNRVLQNVEGSPSIMLDVGNWVSTPMLVIVAVIRSSWGGLFSGILPVFELNMICIATSNEDIHSSLVRGQ